MWETTIEDESGKFPTNKSEQVEILMSCGNCGEVGNLIEYVRFKQPNPT